jgi:hypothetical protein
VCSDGCLLLYDLDIARETAYKIQYIRHGPENEGLGAKTTTTTSNSNDNSPPQLLKSAQPSSNLIDQLFGNQNHTSKQEKKMSAPATATVTPITNDNHHCRQQISSASTSNTGNVGGSSSHTLFISPSRPTAAVTLRPAAKTKTNSSTTFHQAQHASSSSSDVILNNEVDAAVQRRRLAQLLRSYQRYPDRYRMLAWRVLLQLPENRDAFSILLARDVYPAYVHELQRKYPIQNHRLFRRLQRVLSAIAHWSPAFGEVEYLPAFVFPFVKVCEHNDLMAFEVVLSVLVHWGTDFLVRYPFPPLHLLELLEKALEAQDAALHAHFVAHDIHAQVIYLCISI